MAARAGLRQAPGRSLAGPSAVTLDTVKEVGGGAGAWTLQVERDRDLSP